MIIIKNYACNKNTIIKILKKHKNISYFHRIFYKNISYFIENYMHRCFLIVYLTIIHYL